MPVTPTYPGVYIEEIPSGVRTIVGVATSITAFIGRAKRGPVDDPVTINGFADFERIFGGLWNESRLGFAVRDFFLNGGGQAVIVRLFHPAYDSREDRDKMKEAADAVVAVAKTAAGDDQDAALDDAKVDDIKKKAAEKVKEYETKSEAEKNAAQTALTSVEAEAKKDVKVGDMNKAIEASVANEFPVTKATLALNTSKAKAAADAVVAAAKTAAGDDQGAVLDDTKVAEIKNKAKEQADKFKTKSDAEKTAAETALSKVEAEAIKDKKVSEMTNAIETAMATKYPVDSSSSLKLEAAYEGTWGNELRTRVDYDRPKDEDLPESFTAFGITANDLFNLTVRDMKSGVTEVFRNVTVKSGPRTVNKVLENESKLVRMLPSSGDIPIETDQDGVDKKLTPFSKEDEDIRSVGVTETATDGSHLKQTDFTGEGKEAEKKGLYALERLYARSGLFNLLCIPPHNFVDPNWDVDTKLIAVADRYCVKRRAMLIVDPPSSWTDKATAIDKFTSDDFPGVRSKNAAIFFPRLTQPNPLRDNQMEDFVPCGAVAGIFARTDVQRGVWKAPAGLEASLVGVSKFSVPMTDEENGELNPLGINCLRAFPVAGKVVWGSRTLRGADQLADEWKYIPVRRTALYIEESLYRGTQWVVFEPNDEPLWAQIRLNVGAFMHNLFRQGAFQGTTPREAYFVKCDKETTTQNDINQGIVNIVVGFAPLKPAEFVIIKLQQMAGQIEV
jgi:hypothetical protein